MEAILALEDGRLFYGRSIGAAGETTGEVVFNTAMTGYQEVLTDPSYAGQLVTMTCPHIGNYGVNPEDVESRQPFVAGFIVRELSSVVSNWRATESLGHYLKRHGIVGIEGIDTRALVRHIRERGAMRGVISTVEREASRLVAKAAGAPGMVGAALAKTVTCTAPYTWPLAAAEDSTEYQRRRWHVVAYDFGVKFNILRHLAALGCRVTVVPATTTAEEVLRLQPDGVFLSNGPGDPEPLTDIAREVRLLAERLPTFGICLGHQVLALAFGGRTFKLKYGHRGANHPVKNLMTGKVEITSQNHGFAVDPESLPEELEVTHINLNDGTLEGFRHRHLPVFCVQYHPEAAPGPHDAAYLFEAFTALLPVRSAEVAA
ncbi:glutamine-hydrolyzing carbamoyl-phosphate synthase small subunit [Chloracidobacterium sp. D]|uniref:glutamine-hydrolyzing carbamoyl-phosphate synthase small subunit n=1 Tax=Chloracidobacterium sp. D TaxID=2821536 RepID=UPI001B8B7283|nr:glutamine-hydrolyzing carbamoyl-phosphate synthase small subunit [Chloracidobacterium sp. D]QUV81536.1 glutamine-hydrolyzing carbamoyl-phosphate synthase small subunit [Chloracidobacterium sp. D]